MDEEMNDGKIIQGFFKSCSEILRIIEKEEEKKMDEDLGVRKWEYLKDKRKEELEKEEEKKMENKGSQIPVWEARKARKGYLEQKVSEVISEIGRVLSNQNLDEENKIFMIDMVINILKAEKKEIKSV